MATVSLFLAVIFFVLGGVHLYWATGKQWGLATAIPTTTSGEKLLNPGPVDCVVVGVGLVAMGIFYVLLSGFIQHSFPEWIFNSVGWIIPIIFFIRAIGDFNYVGFFKRTKGTAFASADTRFFSPLCLVLASAGFALQLGH